MSEPLYQLPLTTKPIPPYAEVREQKNRAIREATTVSDRLEAYRKLLEVAQ